MSGCNLKTEQDMLSVSWASHVGKHTTTVSLWWRTYNAHDKLVRGVVTAHQQWVVDDEVTGKEVGVAVDGGTQDGLAVWSDVEWIIMHQFEQVLVKQHDLAALLTLLRLHVPVPQGAL